MRRAVRTVCADFARGLSRTLGAKLRGAYVYGAAAFPGRAPVHDIDFHVILNGPLTGAERVALEELHDSLARRYPPLGKELDGYYILWKDARGSKPPRSEMWKRATDDAWALHRQHIRAGRHVVLHGPDPIEAYPPATWREVEEALRHELRYVEKHLGDYPDYCILNLCRLVYSYETRDVVVSKAAAAAWARRALPEWKHLIVAAERAYAGRAGAAERKLMLAEVGSLFESALARIRAARMR